LLMWFLQLFKREIHQTKKDFRRPTFLFGAAVAYLLVFGILYLPNVIKSIPCVIYDEENSSFSRELIQDFESSDSYKVVGYVTSEEEMRSWLREKKAYVAIEIPHDFSKRAKTGNYSTVLYLTNGANIIFTNITSSAASNIISDFSDRLAAKQVALRFGLDEQKVMHRIHPVSAHLRVLFNSTQGYLYFFMLGLAMVAFQQGILFAVGASALCEVNHPEEAYSSWKLFFTKGVFYWILSMVSYSLVILIVTQVLDIPLKAPLWQLLSLAAIFICAVISFCVFFASFFPSELSFVRGIILYPVPSFIFSGYTWPTESLGNIMQLISNAFPLTHFSNTVRELFLIGSSPHYLISIEKLVILTLFFSVSGGFLYCRRLRLSRNQHL
jgi:ABC-2 type transport system permease protein